MSAEHLLQPNPLEYDLSDQIGDAPMSCLRRMKTIFIHGKIIRGRFPKNVHD